MIASYAPARLESGRVDVDNTVEIVRRGERIRGRVCEISRVGRGPLLVVIVNRAGMHFARLENVAPGAKQKSPERNAK